MIPRNDVLDRSDVPLGARTITEGAATVLYTDPKAVFYNQVQILNRDLSISAIRTYDVARRRSMNPREVSKAWLRHRIREEQYAQSPPALTDTPLGTAAAAGSGAAPPLFAPAVPTLRLPRQQQQHAPGTADIAADAATVPASAAVQYSQPPGLRILEALAASGLRSMRYAREIPHVDHIITNDMDPAAAAAIALNAEFNGIDARLLQPCRADATLLMYLCRDTTNHFDVVDLDPYGSASPFLDAALQSIADGGLLAVTCTDMQVLAGNGHPDVCHAKYGGFPVRGGHVHEQALRLVLGAIEGVANRYRRSITPLLSISVDFYVRMFIRVDISPSEVNLSGLKLGSLLQCTACPAFWVHTRGTQPLKKRRDGVPGASRKQARETPPGAAAAAAESSHKRARVDGSSSSSSSSSSASTAPSERSKNGSARASSDAVSEAADACAAASAAGTVPVSGTGSSIEVADAEATHAPTPGTVHASVAHAVGSLCPHCGRAVHMGGPLWTGRLHDATFAAAVLDDLIASFGVDGRGGAAAAAPPAAAASAASSSSATAASLLVSAPTTAAPAAASAAASRRPYDLSLAIPRPAHDHGSNDVETVATSRRRLIGIVRSVTEELLDAPLYFEPSGVASALRMGVMPLLALQSAVRARGYAYSGSHAAPNAFKTTAPPDVWLQIFRDWEALPGHGVQPKYRNDPKFVCHAILTGQLPAGQQQQRQAGSSADGAAGPAVGGSVFDDTADAARARAAARSLGPRFVSNPQANWGPKSRASGGIALAAASRAAAEAAAAAVAAASSEAAAAPAEHRVDGDATSAEAGADST